MAVHPTENIVAETLRIFMRCGVKAVTMDDIARHLGISKRTLYEQFGDKDTLLLETVKLALDHQKQRQRELYASAAHPFQVSLELYRELLQYLRSMNSNCLTDIEKYHPRVAVYVREEGERRMKQSIAMLREGQRRGYVRPELQPEILARLLGLQFGALLTTRETRWAHVSVSELFDNLVLTYARGIATPEGLRLIEAYVGRQSDETQQTITTDKTL